MENCRISATELACRRGERLLFRGLSMDLAAGEALQVTGPNGTGKSSLMRILAGLLRPYAGAVDRQGAIALLDERPALDEHLPLGKALDFWARIDGEASPETARLGIAELLDIPVRYLSTGQRKRAALARLTGQGAPVWLLDEPLNGLDSKAVTIVEAFVAQHCASGGIAIIASHQQFTLANMQHLAIADFAA